MIAWLRGQLVAREHNRAVIDVQGVGYEVFAPARTVEAWSQSTSVDVHVSTQVREDAITLYGFGTPTERQAFQTLIGVSGIGPKLALACLDALPVQSLTRAIEVGDHATLARVPGVGKKTAMRLALELKGKMPDALDAAQPLDKHRAVDDTLAAALLRLGYNRSEIDHVRIGLLSENIMADAPIADRLRAALKLLSRAE